MPSSQNFFLKSRNSAILILAALVSYSTACLASRLAGSLALAAAACDHALLVISGIKSLYMFHSRFLL